MSFTINYDVVQEIIEKFKNYELSEDDDVMIESCGVNAISVRAPNILIGNVNVVTTCIVVSWGIVQHTDWGKSNILIPINSEGYCFKFYDLNGAVKEVNSPEIGSPIYFNPVADHSLASYRRLDKPFIAINIDYIEY